MIPPLAQKKTKNEGTDSSVQRRSSITRTVLPEKLSLDEAASFEVRGSTLSLPVTEMDVLVDPTQAVQYTAQTIYRM